jgi:hypothetical protein
MKNVVELMESTLSGNNKGLLVPEINTSIMQIQTTDGCVLGCKVIYSSSEVLAALDFTID